MALVGMTTVQKESPIQKQFADLENKIERTISLVNNVNARLCTVCVVYPEKAPGNHQDSKPMPPESSMSSTLRRLNEMAAQNIERLENMLHQIEL